MDSIPSRNTRGRARRNPPPHIPNNQSHGAQPEHPQQHVVSIPQPRHPCVFRGEYIPRPRQPCVLRGEYIPRPRQPAGGSVIRMPNWSNQSIQPRASSPQLSSPINNGGQSSNSSHFVKQSSGELNKSPIDVVINEVAQLQIQEEKNAPIPIGRRDVRTPQTFMNNDKSVYMIPRPISSQNGKQGYGGENVDLVTNYFPINTYKNGLLYKYRVDFSPEEDRISVKRGLLGKHRKFLGGYLFDGTSMISGTKYASEKFELASKRDCDELILIITITFTNEIHNNDYEFLQVLDLIPRKCHRNLGHILLGRNYFDEKAKVVFKNHKLQVYPGYKTTIGLFDSGLLYRVDTLTKIMREETILDFFNMCWKSNSSNLDKMNTFKMGVIGNIIYTKYNNVTYRINDVDDQSTPKSTFIKNGTKQTYIDYYKERWGITIRHHNQPMLVSKKKNFFTNDEENLIYLVPELCSPTGLTEAMRKNGALTRDLSAYTRMNPTRRIEKYNDHMNNLQSNEKCKETLKEWNLTFSTDLLQIKGRILPNERLYYNSQLNSAYYSSDTNADWTYSVRSKPFYKSAKMHQRWIVVYPSQYEHVIKKFVRTLKDVGRGMSFQLEEPEYLQNGSINNFLKALEQIINYSNPSLILCVIENKNLYDLIKRKLCVDRAVPSQVVLSMNVEKCDKSVCTKIVVQLNCKLGGAPWMVNIPRKGLMIVGFDVFHDKSTNISYGAIVASISDDYTRFYSNAQPHHSGEEISSHFILYMTLALHSYKNLNNALPTSIIIYRDGVGDGQISYVHEIEVAGIKKACEEFYEKEVPLAFIIVNKRINTRLFLPTRSGFVNPKPGTIVDSVITDPTKYDFFLVSQNVRSGTVTPTYYNVIVDTLPDWSPKIMQILSYKLSHLYYNWSGTIRVPAHCQLAHKLAYLVGKNLKKRPHVALNDILYFL